MTDLHRNLRYALRQLRKSPGFTAVAVLALAVGIGANLTIFSVVDGLWLRPLPVKDPARLIRISSRKMQLSDGGTEASYAQYLDYRSQATALSDIAAVSRRQAVLRIESESRLLLADVLSPNYFSIMGVDAVIGRSFTKQELGGPRPAPLVMLSYGAWQLYFGGDYGIAGKVVVLNNYECVVAGVLPRGFRGTEPWLAPDLWIPSTTWLQINPKDRGFMLARDYRDFELFARLAPGRSIGEAQAELSHIAAQLALAYPKTDAGYAVNVEFETKTRSRGLYAASVLLLGFASLVLLIALANISSLLLARAETRRKEMAVRIALGASRAQLIVDAMTESVPLCLLSTTCALILAYWIIHLLLGLVPPNMPLSFDFRFDVRLLLFAGTLTLVSPVLVGALSAWHVSQLAPVMAIKEPGTSDRIGRRWHSRDLIVGAQVAVSLVLLACAGLLLRALTHLQTLDAGFNRQQQMVLMDLVDVGHRTSLKQDLDLVVERVRTLPGVDHAALMQFFPLSGVGDGARKIVSDPDQPPKPGEELYVGFNVISPEYFQTMGTHLTRGRAFSVQDQDNGPKVVILSEALVRRLFSGREPLGRYLQIGGMNGERWQIVGIAEDAKYSDLSEPPRPFLYFPFAQSAPGGMVLAVATAMDARGVAPAVRRAVDAGGSDISGVNLRTLDDQMQQATYLPRLMVNLLTSLGLLGTLLAVIGLYGVVSYFAARQTHGIGVRIAVGATLTDIFWFVVRRGLRIAGIGVLIGLAGALVCARLITAFLYGVPPTDIITFSLVTLLLLVAVGAACFIPAHRATRVDPVVALRYE